MSTIDLSGFDLPLLPSTEDDEFEFKSSQISTNDLKTKLGRAASGFANSGGGYFIAGVDAIGDADGGIPESIGNQDIRDWVDQIISQVSPTPNYSIKLIDDPKGRGHINTGSAVLVVAIGDSYLGPHMAPDKRYYIRAGAHTVPARHFIVDAIWAKRHFSKPRLTHIFRMKPDYGHVIQLGIVALTDAPAIDVEIEMKPLPPKLLQNYDTFFPLKLPVIDRQNSFFLDVSTWYQATERFGTNIELHATYKDLAGNGYVYEALLKLEGYIAPLIIGKDSKEKIAEALDSIEKLLTKLLK